MLPNRLPQAAEMIKGAKHTRIIPMSCKCDPCMLRHTGNKIFFQGIFYFFLQKILLCHDPAAKHNDLRIDHIANICDPPAQNIRHLINCPNTEPISSSGLLKNMAAIPFFLRLTLHCATFLVSVLAAPRVWKSLSPICI